MNTRKPASLDGSLLARKGSAVPAVPLNSPLTEELGEPRPQATVVPFEASAPPEPTARIAPETPSAAAEPQAPRYRQIVAAIAGLAVLAALVFAFLKFVPSPDRAALEKAANPSIAAGPAVGPPDGAAATETASAAPPQDVVKPVSMAPVAPEPAAPIAIPPEAPSPPEPAARVASKPSAPVPARKPDKAPVSASVAPYTVQLASLPTSAAARREAARLDRRLSGVPGRSKIVTVRALGADRQTVYRLRMGGYSSFSAARNACRRIRQQKIDCLVVKR